MKNTILLYLVLFLTLPTFAQSESTPIHVQVTGKGQPLLLIPGFTVPGSIWDPMVKELEKNYECHVVTLAGFGGKAPISFPWLPKVNTAIKEYILKNNLKNTSVVGHSLGGTIALWLASQSQIELNHIILVDALPAAGALMIPNYNPENLVYESPYNDQQLAMDATAFEQMAAAMSKGMSLEPAAQQKIKNWMLQSDRKTYVYGYTDYLKLDLREALKQIDIPVTIIAASQPYGEAMVKQTYSDQYANLKDYNLVVAQDSAHFIMLDKPNWFLQRIQLILAAH
ncbi:MAG: alpha/beta hydrolase [Cytophagaceae bacterium]|nr:alpha/beta hydrolase [Cytophagaceae bacterium]